MASARSSSNVSSVATLQFLDQLHERTLSRLASRLGRGLADGVGQFLVTEAELYPADQQLAVVFTKSCQRRLVSLDCLLANRAF